MTPSLQDPSDGIITLSRFAPRDAATMCAGDRDAAIRLRFAIPHSFVPTEAHSLAVIARWEDEWTAGTRFPLAVRDAQTGTLLGGCELQPTASDTANLSFWTYPPHRGRGIASRAVALACKVAFGELARERLELLADPENTASREVARRNAFTVAGTRTGQLLHVRHRTHEG